MISKIQFVKDFCEDFLNYILYAVQSCEVVFKLQLIASHNNNDDKLNNNFNNNNNNNNNNKDGDGDLDDGDGGDGDDDDGNVIKNDNVNHKHLSSLTAQVQVIGNNEKNFQCNYYSTLPLIDTRTTKAFGQAIICWRHTTDRHPLKRNGTPGNRA